METQDFLRVINELEFILDDIDEISGQLDLTKTENTKMYQAISSIEKSDPPDGVTEGEWYEYVIGVGSSEIKGKRSGSLKSVTEYVKEYAENLNQRSALGYSSYAARKVQK